MHFIPARFSPQPVTCHFPANQLAPFHCHSKPSANTTGLDPVRTCWYFGQLRSFQQDIDKDVGVPTCLSHSSSRGVEILGKSLAEGAENRSQKSALLCGRHFDVEARFVAAAASFFRTYPAA